MVPGPQSMQPWYPEMGGPPGPPKDEGDTTDAPENEEQNDSK